MSTDTTENPPVEETLAWEAEKRPRAAMIAIAGGILTIVGNVLLTILTSNGPTEEDGFVSLTEALGARTQGQEPDSSSLIVRQIDEWGNNAAGLTASTILNALAVVCLALTVLFLYRATYARSTQVGRVPYYSAVVGLVSYPIGRAVREISQWVGAAGFEDDAVRTAGTARDVLATGPVAIGSLIEIVGTFALAVAVVLVALNAMRVGLLTRFFGVLGILAGVLTVFQADQPGIVRAFWLVGVGLVIAGRLNVPPAWETGRAEPWPTQQQLREQREAARAEHEGRGGRPTPADRDGDGDGDGGPGEADAEPAPTPGQARKKRKRRR